MTAATESASPAPPRDWLRALGGARRSPPRRAMRRAGAWLFADALAAIGFAAGLALSLSALARGPAAALPWLALMSVSAALRGLFAWRSILAGSEASADLRSLARRGALATRLREAAGGRRTAGAAVTALVEGVEALDGYFVRFAPARVAAAVAPVMVIAAVAVASPIAAAILLATLIPFAVGMTLAGMAAAEESRRQFEALARLSGVFLDRVRGLPLVLAYQAEATETAALAQHAEALRRRTARVLRIAFVSSGVLEFFAALSVALVAVYCGFNLLRLLPFPVPETLDLPRALFVLALAPEVYVPLRRLAAAYHERQQAEAAVPALAAASPRERPAVVPRRAPRLRFRDVTVRYPDTDTPVFDRFNLEVPAGYVIALAGPSGSGKSTLLNLLLGLAPLAAGEVWVDDHPLSAHGDFAAAIAFAGQATLVVPGSLADNIALARRDASREDIAAAAAKAGLAGALAARAGGLDAPIDERGGGLSGGERRRLALARALLKPAPILLLDEPTAGLDAAAVRELLPVIVAATRGRTTLIASHDPAVLAIADQIVRL